MERNKRARRRWLIILILLMVTAVGICIYLADYYPADEAAWNELKNPSASVEIDYSEDKIVFTPDHPKAGMIFYPGGKVEYEAYAPLLEACSENGILCIMPHMPANLAVLDQNAANGIPEEHPEVHTWYLAGHSLGGTVASIYAEDHTDQFSGIIFLASYSSSDLSDSGLRGLSIFGSEDGVMNRERYDKNRTLLPKNTKEVVIDGGCHAYFGSYGFQNRDGTPTITRQEQIQLTAQEIANWVLP